MKKLFILLIVLFIIGVCSVSGITSRKDTNESIYALQAEVIRCGADMAKDKNIICD